MNRITKNIFIGLAVLFSSAAVAVGTPKTAMQTQDMPSAEMIKQNKKIVALAAESMNKEMPQTIDKYTILTEIKGDETTLLYVYEINTGAKSDEAVIKEDKTRMKESITTGTCRSSKRFLDARITISYLYKSAKSKVELFRFDVVQSDCAIVK